MFCLEVAVFFAGRPRESQVLGGKPPTQSDLFRPSKKGPHSLSVCTFNLKTVLVVNKRADYFWPTRSGTE